MQLGYRSQRSKNGKVFFNTGEGNKGGIYCLRDCDSGLHYHSMDKSRLAGHFYSSWHSAFAYHSHLDLYSLAAPSLV